ncbi:hypothetical protein [Microbispora triticiradicis]|uniref:hypothetical protein n=1 Tax=Microbispora triticiradicis TaxID=2200763 RepID=UPI0010586FEB|nr:hypothetical protein [Microbispora triticiradicis]
MQRGPVTFEVRGGIDRPHQSGVAGYTTPDRMAAKIRAELVLAAVREAAGPRPGEHEPDAEKGTGIATLSVARGGGGAPRRHNHLPLCEQYYKSRRAVLFTPVYAAAPARGRGGAAPPARR